MQDGPLLMSIRQVVLLSPSTPIRVQKVIMRADSSPAALQRSLPTDLIKSHGAALNPFYRRGRKTFFSILFGSVSEACKLN